jgi:predicted negative regulator of RcsB-dependent stress response
MPEGYNPVHQVVINSFVNYWIPAYKTLMLAALLALIAALAWVRYRRRRAQ